MSTQRLTMCRPLHAYAGLRPALGAVWWALLCLAVMLSASSARAQTPAEDAGPTLEQVVKQLAERKGYEQALVDLDTFDATDVESVITHVKNRTLYTWQDQLVFIPAFTDDGSGKAYPITTPPAEEDQAIQTEPIADAAKADAKAFKVQRKARKALLSKLAVIDLFHTDIEIRRAAAKRVGDTREPVALKKLAELAENDPDAKVRFLAAESAAMIILSGKAPDTDEQQILDAVKQLGVLKSIRAYDMIDTLTESEGLSEADAKVYAQALARIDRHKVTAEWTSHTFRALSLGSILVLIALGLAITFGLMGVINMAHGEMLMVGAIATWATFSIFEGTLFSPDSFMGKIALSLQPADVWFDWYYVVAFPIAFLVAAIAGWLTEVLVVRWLYKRPLDSLLATIGVSLILIQAVRLWKGDNLGISKPAWANGGYEILQDVVLPYNRLFLMALAAACVLSVVLIFRFTKIGLMIRATVQNREMAQALGVNTRRVDKFTFSFGAGLAGLAGYGYILLSNPTPGMGQTFIVQAFQTVVVGGVGKLIGVVVSGLSIGALQKYIEPLPGMDAGWATVIVLFIVVAFIQRKPSGLFPDKGRMANQATGDEMPWLSGGRPSARRDWTLGLSLLAIAGVIIPCLYFAGMISPSTINKLGQYMSFAMIAIGLDLVWGYLGILSLCQCLFFALGGYAMGFYLINHGPMDEFGIPACLAYVMSNVTDKSPPAYLSLFHSFTGSVILGILMAGGVAFIIGATCFRSRVRGVYFSILTQAILVAFWNIWIKNNMMMGGTNGLTFDPTKTKLLGITIAGDIWPEEASGGFQSILIKLQGMLGPYAELVGSTRFILYMVALVVLTFSFLLVRTLVHSRFGRVMVAIRDDETRLRFIGYQTWVYKAAAFGLAGALAGIGGMLYIPQKGIITPKFMEPFWSIMVVVWVALGGRSSLWGAVLGTISVSILYDTMTSVAPDYWKFMLGGLFIFVPLFLPGGLMSIPSLIGGWLKGFKTDNEPAAAPTSEASA